MTATGAIIAEPPLILEDFFAKSAGSEHSGQALLDNFADFEHVDEFGGDLAG